MLYCCRCSVTVPSFPYKPTKKLLFYLTRAPLTGACSKDKEGPTSPEFSGQAFTQPFTYGSYNGPVTFWEPRVALSHLKSNPALDKELDKEMKQPAQHETAGLYPTHYSIRAPADGYYEVAMSQFVQR